MDSFRNGKHFCVKCSKLRVVREYIDIELRKLIVVTLIIVDLENI